MIHRHSIAVLILLLPGAAGLAIPSAPVAKSAAPGRQIDQLVSAFEKASTGLIGISIVDLRTGKTIYAHCDEKVFIPASNQKLLTSAFALERLGGDFQFTTTVYSLGEDLVITGRYDPLLGDPVLAAKENASIYREPDRWAEAVKRKFTRRVKGDLICCVRKAPSVFHHPDWPARHRTKWYGAPVAELNFHNNCFDVTFVKKDDRITPRVSPASRFIRVVDKTRTGPKHLWGLKSSSDDSVVTVSGKVSSVAPDPISVPVSSPPMLLGRVLADRLVRKGVTLGGTIRLVDRAKIDLRGAKVLAVTKTPFSKVLERANKHSLNMVAECLLLRAGDGTFAGSAKAMRETLIRTFSLDEQGLSVSDGSGLSRKNRVSPKNLTKLLTALTRRKDGAMFLASLPRAGEPRTSLRKRLRREPYRGRVAGKTGTIAGVRALSGYILDKSDRPVFAFSILANNLRGKAVWNAKNLQNQICALLIEQLAEKK
ncbi:MAG TPA: D-alanyl-D-alanine carboxypeptidase/D-alanyl-D-alanine-endopeptidase [Phycisphaerae bacterium]|nr:D-alanyl-D-alanine carboxypeptidase/D-alanyl-D-alanine-endopeptidase [Phycisphaerae bacterium]